MATRYFIDTNPLNRKVGGLTPEIYDTTNGNAFGVVATDDESVAAQIIASPGTEEITQEQYEYRLKKKAGNDWRSLPPLSEPKSETEPTALKGEGAIVVENPGDPSSDPKPGDPNAPAKASVILEELTGVIGEPKATPAIKPERKTKAAKPTHIEN